MILKVARIGHPVVRAAARSVPPDVLASADFQPLVDDMVDTMHEYEGVGLAGPQVHVGLRVAVLEIPASDERARVAVPLTVLVNPVVTPLGEEKEHQVPAGAILRVHNEEYVKSGDPLVYGPLVPHGAARRRSPRRGSAHGERARRRRPQLDVPTVRPVRHAGRVPH